MLFQYIYPANHNFGLLNQYLIEFINSISHTNASSRFIPSRYFHPDFLDIINSSEKLREKFQVFFTSFKVLDGVVKNDFIDRLNQSQNCQGVFSDTTQDISGWKADSLNQLIGNDSFKQLADYLFTCVKYDRWKIKDHYRQIYEAMEHKICPFCGVHPMHNTFKEDYDHLAPKSLYPLLSVNPENLAPMCMDCNRNNKGPKDVLYTVGGVRRMFVHPYSRHIQVVLNFEGSVIPQTDIQNDDGNWRITFNPDTEDTNNWNEIFNIKTRYLDDFIKPNYEQWLHDFVADCIEDGIDLRDENNIRAQLSSAARKFNRKWYEQANIIKGPLFEFLVNSNNEVLFSSIISTYNRLNRAA